MDSQAGHVMTIANSIIGVSLLAMPYCFKQCGILLSVLILILSNAISRLSCHLMLKSAVMARRRTFEFLAFHTFGPLGKFITEVGLIGFLVGTCIAYFVVMGDLGPAIISKMTGARATDTMRTSILMALALFCVLPLGLLRNIDSLNSVCTATIGFYFCLVLKIMAESAPHILSGDWVSKVELWRPAGILQCLPIFSMALSCQTQIFEVYQAIPTASLEKMNNLIRVAVNICTSVYIFVGIFGYIAFANQPFSGNILMSFSTSLISDVMKIGFVLSLAFSFPLIIFPCRASLYSLLYRRTYALHEGSDKYIPESRFKALTFIIVLVSLVTGVMTPNIELVLGLVGSTIGIMICVLFPATCFICISTKNTNERILAQIMLFVGVLIMVLGTYANLFAVEEIAVTPAPPKETIHIPDILKLVEEDPALKVIDIPNTTKNPIDWKPPENKAELKKKEEPNKDVVKEVRHEPPQPEEPPESNAEVDRETPIKEKGNLDKSDNNQQLNKVINEVDAMPKDLDAVKKSSNQLDINIVSKKTSESAVLQQPVEENKIVNAEVPDKELIAQAAVNNDGVHVNLPQKESNLNLPPLPDSLGNIEDHINLAKEQEPNAKSNGKKVEEVDIEAIKKEENELLEQEKEKLKDEEKKNLDLIKKMEQQNEDQKKLVEASKKLLEELKQKQKELEDNKQQNEIEEVKQKKIKAVEQIEEIAKEAIKKLSGDENENVPVLEDSNKKGNGGIEAIAKEAIEKISGGDQQNEPQLQSNLKKEEKVELFEDVAKKAIETISNKENNHNMRSQNSLYENKKGNDIQINNVIEQQQPHLLNNVDTNKNLNVNNDLNKNADLKQNVDDRGTFKLALNKGNVVPLPIAMSNNFSGSYRNLVRPVNNVPRDSVPNLPAVDNSDKIQENNQQIKPEVKVGKPTDIKDILQKNMLKQEQDKNILDFLKTNAEKDTAINQDKQQKNILHREIRSADDKEAIQDNEYKFSFKNGEKADTQENVDKRVKKTGEIGLKESEDSCDKSDKNVGQFSEKVISLDDKPGSTEAPVIRMITKLSEPELVNIKLPDIDNSILKPLKRDLKSYKFRKRK